MTKIQTMISIDQELKHKAKTLNINISKVTNDVLRNLISSFTNEDVDIYEIQKELELIEGKIIQLQTRKNELVAQKTSFEEKKLRKKNKELKEQLAMAESIKRSGLL